MYYYILLIRTTIILTTTSTTAPPSSCNYYYYIYLLYYYYYFVTLMERNAAIDAVAEEKDNFDVEEQRRQDIITAVENTTGKVLEAICKYRICPYEPMGNNKNTKTCGVCHNNRRSLCWISLRV